MIKNYISLMFYCFGINFMILSIAGIDNPLRYLLSFFMIPFPLIYAVLGKRQLFFYLLNIPYVLISVIIFLYIFL